MTDQNKNGDDATYIVGVDSYGPADPNTPGPTKYSYLKSSHYTEAMDQIPLGTDFTGLAPDVIRGKDSHEIIRTGQRKADIITNGDDAIILAGSGGGLIDTGVGKDNVIFMPSAAGQMDPGTTVVVSPGKTSTVVGGPNDKLVLLADRLTSAGGASLHRIKSGGNYFEHKVMCGFGGSINWTNTTIGCFIRFYQIANEPSGYHRKSSGGFTNSL